MLRAGFMTIAAAIPVTDPAAPAAGIRLAGVDVARGGRPVFRGLDLDLAERRIGLVGANGSGKSTLLRLVNGLVLPDAGSVTVNGLDTRRDRRRLPAEAGFVFQNVDHQIIFPTVGEEIAFGPREQGLSKAEAGARAVDLLARHGCAGWETRGVDTLSEGQKQLICILSALACGPRILLLDEPFSSLDLATRLALSARLAALDLQVVMASHDLDLLAGFDRVIWIRGGAVAADGRPDAVLAAYAAHARAAAGAAIDDAQMQGGAGDGPEGGA